MLNYVLLRPCTAMIAFISSSQGVYGEGELWNPLKAYLWVVLINSWSQAGPRPSPPDRRRSC